jgi:hypothetical protein
MWQLSAPRSELALQDQITAGWAAVLDVLAWVQQRTITQWLKMADMTRQCNMHIPGPASAGRALEQGKA